MRKVLGYYKVYIPIIVVIVGLLWIRAYGELNLPDYTSRIVDTGISQFGLESLVPNQLARESFHAIRERIPVGEQAGFTSAFRFYVPTNTYRYIGGEFGEEVAAEIYARITAILHGIQFTFEDLRHEMILLGYDMEQQQMRYIVGVGGLMLLMLLLIMASVILETFLSSRMAAGIARRLRRDIFRKVVSFSNSEFDKFSTASLITRSTNDVQQVQMITGMFMRFVVFTPMLGIGAVARVVTAGSEMTWTITIALLATLLFVAVIFILVTPKFKIIQKLIDRLNLVTRETLSGLMVVRAFNRDEYEEEKFDKANANLRNLNIFVNRVFAFMNPIMMLALNITTLVIIWIGGHMVDAGTLQVGVMFAFLQYTIMIIMSFMMMTMIITQLPRALVSINRIAEILKADTSIKDPKNPKTFDDLKKGLVEYKNVSFKYPGAEEYVLRDLTFTVLPGQTTAFIGSTGAGKSSVVNLLPRLYDVTDGQVMVEGVDVRDVTTKALRRKIGYVPQKALLFSGTIGSNIKFASADGYEIKDNDMKWAADIAQAGDFIAEKANQYDDEIAQAGANVSGGQKQRISIARAIAKRPNIFVFDDSFSALDYKTDAALRAATGKNIGGSTLLIVAQRIGTIKNADQIIVLDNGRMVGIGKHEELLKTCEVYRQIALSQLSEEELGLGGAANE
ncbi:MAG: ABC transporter ATP-binding protein/permease [Defluviitaleaceae bacterium]|nr:ABC transporter ATP-binding protein/permease [Defluviitaleaceae bacterium]